MRIKSILLYKPTILGFIELEFFQESSVLKPLTEFQYAISESFDSFKLRDLKSIYKNLQAVKNIYCEK